MSGSTFVVIGGAGAMGRITVRDLVEFAPSDAKIVIADYNEKAGKALARSYKDKRVSARFVNVKDVAGTAKALKGVTVVLNSTQHQLNLPVMQACLRAGCHYTDLGGLFHVTREQLKLHAQFKKKNLLAVLGMGAAPGIVNILARKAADAMETVREIHIYVGNVDRTPGRVPSLLGASYSMQTIMEEASTPAALFTNGKFTFVEAMSGAVELRFPSPVGLKKPAYTLHSEVATLPLSYKHKGVREVSFRIAFSEDLTEKLKFLRALGLLRDDEIRVGKASVVPQALMLRLLAEVPPGAAGGVPDEYEVLRVIVRGVQGGRELETTLDCHTAGMPSWGMGIDIDTGCPPSICAQLIARGEMQERGALPPERCVPVGPFVAEMGKRGMTVREETRPAALARPA